VIVPVGGAGQKDDRIWRRKSAEFSCSLAFRSGGGDGKDRSTETQDEQ
jgi:hypothetical protein